MVFSHFPGASLSGLTACLVALACATGCGAAAPQPAGDVVLNEIVSDNDGAAIDELGEADDYIELANFGDTPARLDAFVLRDSTGEAVVLPKITVAAGDVIVLWADGDPEQGPTHLPFKISSTGEHVTLETRGGKIVDEADVPALAINETFARTPNARGELAKCRFATPGRSNGDRCEPTAPPELSDDMTFAPFEWPEPWPALHGPLVMNELLLRPAGAIEVLNVSDETIELDDYTVRVAPHLPGQAWPSIDLGIPLEWTTETLAPGERAVVSVPADVTTLLEGTSAFEGVATIFERDGRAAVDRIDFMDWPEGAALARVPDATGQPRFCATGTLGEANDDCAELRSRELSDRTRDLYTRGDFEALAAGDTSLSSLGVKFVIDLAAGNTVHFISTLDWALHYTFIRERIDGDSRLDRCDPTQSQQFNADWRAFSVANYDRAEGRRYLLGTLEHHTGSDLWTVAFTLGDQVSGAQMVHAFFTVLANVRDPKRFALRPSEPRQVQQLLPFNGQLPIIGMNAPFQGIDFQALTEGIGFGVLTFVPAAELGEAPLGHDIIVVTDDVPNDIPLVGGLITEALQTPLAHVNILSKSRNTPNMALRGARSARELEPLFGKLIRLAVTPAGFEVREASSEEADAFFQSREPKGPRIMPRLDTTVRGVQPLAGRGLPDLPVIGAKAAQLAELAAVNGTRCGGPVPVPVDSFAIPVVHSLDHYAASGALERLQEAERSPDFRSDPARRAEVLAEVRELILETPVDPELLEEIVEAIDERYGNERVRMRSSSNTEDLPSFNGAGLYTSVGVAIGDPDHDIEEGIRTVWASLFSLRAYDERELAHIDQSGIAMGILVHPAFLSERANSVAISRNVLDPTRSDMHYFNIQRGEAAVANPAPGVVSEQLTRRVFPYPGSPELEYQSYSSFSPNAPIMTLAEIRHASCYLRAIHDHFRSVIDPEHENRWFAVDIELKLMGDEHELVIKQARPYSFGNAEIPADCRDF